ncbi:MAG TPA: formimidoylglutamate deiminase [Acidimicrobiia bacterium]
MTKILNRADNPRAWRVPAVWLGAERLRADAIIETTRGHITAILEGSTGSAGRLDGIVLPGLVNAHSHAFHRLLRGRTHRQGGDFWLWRTRMYEEAALLTPESYEDIAAAVYMEMALAGITTVGEFHYVHHQPGGVPYDDPNEMGHSLIRAARRAGIRICLLDAGYFRSGFDEQEMHPLQIRFRDDSVDDWLDRVQDLATTYANDDDVVVGLAPHSVRAVPREGLSRVAEVVDESTPVHIHVSEQPTENQDCLEATGMTPVGLLETSGLLGPMTTLVHATHLSPEDVAAIGKSGSGVCYCATTERDLADGLGPAAELHTAGAHLSVGSDSHAIIDLFEETRGIELHQRLLTGNRGVMEPRALMDAATTGGSRTLGFGAEGLTEGAAADFVVIDLASPRLTGLDPTNIDGIVFAASAADVTDTFVGGDRIVADRNHPGWDQARPFLKPSHP